MHSSDESAGQTLLPDDGRTRWVRTADDALDLLDLLFDEAADRWSARGGAAWWDGFYGDRKRPVPFFRDAPDESLVAWHDAGLLDVRPGTRVLDLGCGPGRNAVWLARQGAEVDALDLSAAALTWGRERAAEAGVVVRFERADALRWAAGTPYDLVYDSGCLHHLPPHRRVSYRALLERALAPGGRFGLACFAADGAPDATGTTAPDVDLYRTGHLGGGLAYAADDLRHLFADLTELDLRHMRAMPDDAPTFGQDFLWAGLWRR